jgi:hypothetical protein
MDLGRSESPVDSLGLPWSEKQAKETPTPSQSITEKPKESGILAGEIVDALFSGAPKFGLRMVDGRPAPTVSYPWDIDVTHNDATDSIQPNQPSFMAATAHKDPVTGQALAGAGRRYEMYQVDAVEVPSWLSEHGIEPGSIGFGHFLGLPRADNLLTDSQYDEDSDEYIQKTRNRDFMYTNPERIGIRAVEMDAVYDRLVEFQDLYEAFQESPERITILNNQSPGDLYAHLFSTFLTPPGYAESDQDPTGLQVQILAILRVLNLKGIWHDFSLVEWRIRLGQLLFSDPEPVADQEAQPLWTERDILLLQISLSCELLLRLDAITAKQVDDNKDRTRVSTQEMETFRSLTNRKTDWDLILARRFLDNVLVIKGNDNGALTPVPESRGLFSILGGNTPKELPRSDIILLPQHQSLQLSGLLYFATSIKWPNIDSIVKSLAEKLGVADQNPGYTTQPSSPSGWSFNPTTPSIVSVYGTPLQTPRSASHQLDDYFGRIQKPAVKRNNSRSLRMPLSGTLLSLEDSHKTSTVNIGGWLSRSFLTGMVLPGEAISHFLMSTLLENDQLAMSTLGDSANLYGGFVFNGKSWWSKASIVGRVMACTDGAQECMGWIYVDKLPDRASNGWHSIHSEQLPPASRTTFEKDLVSADSSSLPTATDASIRSKDLVMPKDLEVVSNQSMHFLQWDLTPLNPDLIDSDADMGPPTESDIHTPSLTFRTDYTQDYVLTLTYEVQFVTSWPCFTPGSTSATKRSQAGTLSHTSSKRSVSTKLSRSNSHGFEPLLSHPPEAADIAPQRSHLTESDGEQSRSPALARPVVAHPLHASYRYEIVPVTGLADPNFMLPFTVSANKLPTCSSSTNLKDKVGEDATLDDPKTVVIVDARGETSLQLFARAWCADKGLHAVIGRVERTCLACCIREARGLGVNIVIRV